MQTDAKSMNVTFSLVLGIGTIAAVLGQSTITIKTPCGEITGLRQAKVIGSKSYTYDEFRRIPFAKPPIGNLRFQKPVKYGPWVNTLNATLFGPSCMQAEPSEIMKPFIPNKTMSENCLFLNIYIPTDKPNKKAVMIWIHGGSYLSGTGMLYDGAYLASVGDVIVVTINYRLGVFGFLSTGSSLAMGNYGLWDQKLAIEWVKENIESFGGNVDDITIFGESAGGFSVSLHSLIPENKGLFSRVIAQSGVATSYFATEQKLVYYSNRLMGVVNCNSSSENERMICLRSKSAIDLQKALQYLYSLPLPAPHFYLVFAPRIDRDLIKNDPNEILKDKSSAAYEFFRSLDMVVGNVDSEGSLLLGSNLQKFQKTYNFDIEVGVPQSVFCDHIVATMVSDIYNNQTDVQKAICTQYGHSLDGTYRSMDSVYYFGDFYFYSKSVEVLNAHSDRNSTSKSFQYISSKRTILSKRTPLWFEGSSHASELPLLFPFYNFISKKSEDFKLSITMMQYWANFAKYGDPNDGNLPTWPAYTQTSKTYQALDVNIKTEQDLYKNREYFWLIEIPNIINNHTDSMAIRHSDKTISKNGCNDKQDKKLSSRLTRMILTRVYQYRRARCRKFPCYEYVLNPSSQLFINVLSKGIQNKPHNYWFDRRTFPSRKIPGWLVPYRFYGE